METALLKTKSKADMQLLLKLAAKLNIEGRLLSDEKIEDSGMHIAIKKWRTGHFTDTEKFIKKMEEA